MYNIDEAIVPQSNQLFEYIFGNERISRRAPGLDEDSLFLYAFQRLEKLLRVHQRHPCPEAPVDPSGKLLRASETASRNYDEQFIISSQEKLLLGDLWKSHGIF